MATTLYFDRWCVELDGLAGWHQIATADAGYLFRHGESGAMMAASAIADASLPRLVRDMAGAPESMTAWLNVVDKGLVQLEARTTFRVITLLNPGDDGGEGVALQAQYYFELMATSEPLALLCFAFTYAQSDEKRRDRFDGVFTGMRITELN